MMRAFALLALSSALVLCSGAAHAAEPDPADAAFRRGIALMESGAVNEACVAFEQSERLESKAGTLLNLAGCYERASRWEDAYRTFEKAREAARGRQRADWEAIAAEHLAALRPKLSLVTVDATAMSGLPAARVTVDGRSVAADELRRGLALSPGPHVIRAEATGHRTTEQTLTTPPDARVTLPALERDPASAATASGSPNARVHDPSTRKTVGLVLSASGVAALAFGAIGGVVASGALADAKDACNSYPDDCTPAAGAPNDRATTWSTLSTVALAGGAALVVVGVALYFWPSPKPAATSGSARGQTPAAAPPRATIHLTRSGLALTF